MHHRRSSLPRLVARSSDAAIRELWRIPVSNFGLADAAAGRAEEALNLN
jgi:hypothetical protein